MIHHMAKSRVEYDKIQKGEVAVKGMPQGLPFKNPSSYGKVSRVEYDKIQKGEVAVKGMPQGLPLRTPHHYGKE